MKKTFLNGSISQWRHWHSSALINQIKNQYVGHKKQCHVRKTATAFCMPNYTRNVFPLIHGTWKVMESGETRWVPWKFPEETLCPSFKRVKKEDPQELPTCQPHLCAWEGRGTPPPGSCAKARGGQGDDSGQPCLIILVTFCNEVTTTREGQGKSYRCCRHLEKKGLRKYGLGPATLAKLEVTCKIPQERIRGIKSKHNNLFWPAPT